MLLAKLFDFENFGVIMESQIFDMLGFIAAVIIFWVTSNSEWEQSLNIVRAMLSRKLKKYPVLKDA